VDKATNSKRNPVVVIARARKAGAMRDKRKRRAKDRLRKEIAAMY
jgi:protein required for attachment to host cells